MQMNARFAQAVQEFKAIRREVQDVDVELLKQMTRPTPRMVEAAALFVESFTEAMHLYLRCAGACVATLKESHEALGSQEAGLPEKIIRKIVRY